MTGLLQDMLRERADRRAPGSVDVASVIEAGNRRLRRRRATVGSLAAAAVAAGVLVAPHALLASGAGGRDADGQVAGRQAATVHAFAERRPTYALGTVIHYGARSIDVRERIGSFVQADGGFVYTTDDGRVHLADGRGTEEIGRTGRDGLHVRSDDTGPLAAWVKLPAGRPAELVVYDTAGREEVVRTHAGTRPGMKSYADDPGAAYVLAVDDGTVYWRSDDGLVATVVASGSTTVLQPGTKPFDVADVAGGLFAHRAVDANGSDQTLRLSSDLADPGPALPSGRTGFFSPAAEYFTAEEGDEVTVYDTADRSVATPTSAGYEFVSAYAWLDEHTLSMIGIRQLGNGPQPIDILRCTVPKGACELVAADVTTYDESAPVDLALPFGRKIG